MELLNNNIEVANKQAKEQMLLDITSISYNTWLKHIEQAFMDKGNIIIEVENDFVKNILENRYLDFIKCCYKKFINFENIQIRVSGKIEGNIDSTFNKNEILKIATASEMKKLAEAVLAEEIKIDETVQIELKNILNTINIIAKTGSFSTTIILSYKQTNEEVIKKIMDILIANGYRVNLKPFLGERNILEVNWN